ncbi:MAG: hypothetical protein K2K48_02805 [Anaeroplasmataceae bacterium]|nr:hypothetical protein [Anaeroplasmataceae bacterium]
MSILKPKLLCLLLSFIYMLLMFAIIAVPEIFYEKATYNVYNVSHAIYLFVLFLVLIIYSLIAQKKNWICTHKQRDKMINYIFLGLASVLMIIDILIVFIAMIVANKTIMGLLNFIVCFVLIEMLCITILSIIRIRRMNLISKKDFQYKERTGTKYIGAAFNLSFIYTFSFFILNTAIEESYSDTILHTAFLIFFYINLFVICLIWFVYSLCMEKNKLDLIYKKENKIVNIIFTCILSILFFVNIILLIICFLNWKVGFYNVMFVDSIFILMVVMLLSIMNTIKIARKSK